MTVKIFSSQLNGFRGFFILLGFLLAAEARAEAQQHIYAAQIPVINESEQERKRALRAGLAEVVVKVSGKPSALSSTGVIELLDNASAYVGEYQYIYPQEGGVLPSGTTPLLDIRYLEAELERKLRVLHLPVWPADRPGLMLWVTLQEGSAAILVNSEEPPFRTLAALLIRRGIQLETPLFDLQDEMNLGQFNTVAQADGFARATERYQLEHWLHVHYQQNEGGVSGAWQLSGSGEMGGNLVEAQSLTGFMVVSADRVVEQFSGLFSYAPSLLGGSVSLLVENVVDYVDYQQVIAVLQALELVKEVQVAGLIQGELHLDVLIEDEVERLYQALGREQRFTHVAQVGASSEKARRYIWGGQ